MMMTTTTPTTATSTSPVLAGLKVAVDVQHLFRTGARARDRGAEFVLVASGAHVNEGDLALLYAQALALGLSNRGAALLAPGVLTGPYSARNRRANLWGAHAYLACHINAGRGNYARTEHMSMSPGLELGTAIGLRLVRAFPGVIRKSDTVELHSGDRGAVCIRECSGRTAAVIVEPCFGDNPAHQDLLSAPQLAKMGETIAQGVADWWVASHIQITPGA
jgi:N-acetylmuramoyl-L-alanine amidase